MKYSLPSLGLIFLLSLPVYSGSFGVDEFTGMSIEESPLVIPDSKSPDSDNVDPSKDGLTLERRKGQTQKFDISYSTYSVKSVGKLKNNTYDKLLCGYGNFIESVDAGLSKSIIHSTCTSGYNWDFVQYLENIYATNGVDDVFYFNGVSTITIPSAPKGRHIATYNDTFFIANWTNNRARIQHSAYGDPTDWTTGTGYAEGRAFDVADYGEQIIDLEILSNSLLILCSKSIMKLIGTQNPYEVIDVDKSLGCKSKGSVVTHLGWTYFLGSDGQYYKTDGGEIICISDDEFYSAFAATGLAQKTYSFQTLSSKTEWDAGYSSHTTTSIEDGSVMLSSGTTSYTSVVDWNSFTTTNIDTDTVSGSVILDNTRYLDRFTDADYSNNPTWTVTSGGYSAATGKLVSVSGASPNNIRTPIPTELIGKTASSVTMEVSFGSGDTGWSVEIYMYTPTTNNNGVFYALLGCGDSTTSRLVTYNNAGSYSVSSYVYNLFAIGNTYTITLIQNDSKFYLYKDGVSVISFTAGNYDYPESGDVFWIKQTPGDVGAVTTFDDIYFSCYLSGIAISPIIDTGFDTPVWGIIDWTNTTPTSTSMAFYVRSSSMSDMSNTPTYVEQTTDLQQLTGIDNYRYIQLKSTFTTTVSTVTPQLDDVSLNWSTTGYYISDEIICEDINGWGLFEVTEELNAGTIDYSAYSSSCTRTSTYLRDTAVWTAQAKNAIITVSTNTYIYFKSTFTITCGTFTPTLEAVTANWQGGSLVTEDMTALWYKDRLYLGVMATESSNANDAIFVYDPAIGEKGAWWKYLSGINPSVLFGWNNDYYIASSTGPSVCYFLDGDTDMGADIDAYWYTKKLFVAPLYQSSSFDVLSFALDYQSSGNLLIDYYLNGGSSTENTYTIDMTDGSDIIIKNYKLPQNTNGYYIQFKVYNSNGSNFNFYSLYGVTKELPVRMQND